MSFIHVVIVAAVCAAIAAAAWFVAPRGKNQTYYVFAMSHSSSIDESQQPDAVKCRSHPHLLLPDVSNSGLGTLRSADVSQVGHHLSLPITSSHRCALTADLFCLSYQTYADPGPSSTEIRPSARRLEQDHMHGEIHNQIACHLATQPSRSLQTYSSMTSSLSLSFPGSRRS